MPQLGEPIQLNCQLWDGLTTKFVRAFLFDDEGASLGSHDLPHVGKGKYLSDNFLMPDVQAVHATYVVYDDAGYTAESIEYANGTDLFERSATLDQILGFISQENAELEGILVDDGSLEGQIESNDDISGEIEDFDSIEGFLVDDELIGVLNDNSELQGVLEDC